MKDDHKNDGTQAGNGITSEEEQVKELLPPNQHQMNGWKVIKIKPEEQAKAEKLFFLFFPEASHWKPPSILVPFNPTTYLPNFKQEALAILSAGIIGENGLKGRERYKEFFPVDQKDLIIALLDKDYQYRDITFCPGDILKRFDGDFNSMAALARIAGVTNAKIKAVWGALQKWRDEISQAVSKGYFPSNWRELIKEELITSWEYHPKTEAQAFAIIFLGHAPKASDKRIAMWVNAILKSLGRPTAGNSKLREYIKKERKLSHWLRQEPAKNTL